jgi:hypothetical protein
MRSPHIVSSTNIEAARQTGEKMFRIHFTLIFLLEMVFLVLLLECTEAVEKPKHPLGSVSGLVVHSITGRPVKGVKVVAESGISDGDNMIKSTLTALTNKDGTFILRGIRPKTGYVVSIHCDGFESDSAYAFLESHQSRLILDKPLHICEIPESEGVFFWSGGKWQSLKTDFELMPYTFRISDRLNMNIHEKTFWYLPTRAGTTPSLRKYAAGIPSIVANIGRTNRVGTEVVLAVRGSTFMTYAIYPFYFWPALAISACPDKLENCGALEFPEGYYLGLRTVTSRLEEKSQLAQLAGASSHYTDADFQYESVPLHQICSEKVAGQNIFAYGKVELQSGALFILASPTASDESKIYGALLQPQDTVSRKSDQPPLALTSSCGDNKWNELLGIYFFLHKPVLDFGIDNLYDSMTGIIERNKYYANLLKIVKGVLLIDSTSKATTGTGILGGALGTAGFASQVFDINDYATIVLGTLSAGLKATSNPTPEGIAAYVTTNTLGTANNFLAAAKLNSRRKQFEALVGIRDVLDAYYISCGDFSKIDNRLGISDSSTGCSDNRLGCATLKYMIKMGFEGEMGKIEDIQGDILRGVNSTYRAIRH